MSGETAPDPPVKPARRKYRPAIGPQLKKIYVVVLVLLALLGANSAYLGAITFLGWTAGQTYENLFYLWMFLGHLVLGLLIIPPFLIFGIKHMWNTRQRLNKRAVRVGYVLFGFGLTVILTGVLLTRLDGFNLLHGTSREVVYWLHIAAPLLCGWLYWLHRLAGPPIKWRRGGLYLGIVGLAVFLMALFHTEDPRKWNQVGSPDGLEYYRPSLSRTVDGNFIPAASLMRDQYCIDCHGDAHKGWSKSAHRFSSFNNPVYLASIRETKDVLTKREGNFKAARWCAGCHDPVPFFSGAFDRKDFDDKNDVTARAGITCTVCHAITHVNSPRGNADYTIEEPLEYPFARTKNPFLKWVNHQLIKAKPAFHKKTYLKPLHKTAEFCGACHKVHLPKEVNDYRFLRGQNHYDSYFLSGVSGQGAQSFYYPPTAQKNCNNCHMPLLSSSDFGAKSYDNIGRAIHDHQFPAANTGITWLNAHMNATEKHRAFLKDSCRVDIFGVREGQETTGKLHAPLRPQLPTLEPGKHYLLDVVIRTLKLGHHLTQGTVDSNQVWLEITVKSGGKVIGKNGGMNDKKEVDPFSHFVNVFVIDKHGNRIARRNPQDIFTSVYNHQIPPGAAWTAHFGIQLPEKMTAPLEVEAKLRYRKFDSHLMRFVADTRKDGDPKLRNYQKGAKYINQLPVVTLAADTVVIPVAGVEANIPQQKTEIPKWQRWNDYGIGLFLKGKEELKQTLYAFEQVKALGRYDGPLNLARVWQREGDPQRAAAELTAAEKHTDPAPPPWTLAWLTGEVNRQLGHLELAEENFRQVVGKQSSAARARGFDFSKDYRVINSLGLTLFDRARSRKYEDDRPRRDAFLIDAVSWFQKTLELDPENVAAHFNLSRIYDLLAAPDVVGGKQTAAQTAYEEKSNEHKRLHTKYKPDENARDRAVAAARAKYPAADAAAQEPVVYPLQRKGADSFR